VKVTTPVTRRTALLATPLLLAPAVSRAAPPASWPTSLVIGTGSPGAPYIVYGGAVAALLTGTLGIAVSVLSTQGPDQNIVLMEAGQAMLGLVTLGPALQGRNGTGEWTRGKTYRSARAMFPMYDSRFQMVTLKSSGIRSVADMADKRLGAGPRGGTGGTFYPAIFKTLGIVPAIRYGAYSEMASQLKDGQIDIFTTASGTPFPLIAEMDGKLPIDHVAFTSEQIGALLKSMPELAASSVPAGTYASLKADYPTVGMFNFAVAHKDLPDDLVYAIVKAVFANRERLVAASPSARETLAANVTRNSFLPFHPGAVRYYRDIGIAIPDNLAPSD
jgi:TRAP transporter TAXI family solute receptor